MIKLKLLSFKNYRGVNAQDPIRYYFWPLLGRFYRRRTEHCLAKCTGGGRVLEIGFGSGVTLLNLNELYQEIHGVDLTADSETVKKTFLPFGVHPDLRQGSVLDLPYTDSLFDTVLSISILEHLQPEDLARAFSEIWRVLKPGGQLVYGVPVERPMMVFFFQLMGVNIREQHFSTEQQIFSAAQSVFEVGEKEDLAPLGPLIGSVYEIGTFIKVLPL